MSDTVDRALWWLDRAGAVVPVQPGSKHLITGFGAYGDQVRDAAGAAFWFGDRACNLGIVCGVGVVVLDFDTDGEYSRWLAGAGGDGLAYTEKTRRGYHVYYRGFGGSGRVGGIEVLGAGKVCAVAPSVVDGFVYHPLDGCGDVLRELPPVFLSPSAPSLPVKKIAKTLSNGESTVNRVKAAWSCVDVAERAGVAWASQSRDKRWLRACCPFHDDHRPSFWVDTRRGTWGCHTCDIGGDVINLYARLHGLSDRDAIAAMAVAL